MEQYPNRPFHQLSFHVPLLVSKRAVVRHKIKRILIRTSETFLAQKGQAPYYKAFVTLHKMKLAPLLSLLEAKKWEEVETMLSQQRTQVFSSFLHYDAKSSSQKKSHFAKSSSSSQ
nr:MAG TPA: Ribonuclease P [Caudoviricetes sp.]DAX26813.1 MAG TPA: Ribonuclease P [Caudoviricetes sp.]